MGGSKHKEEDDQLMLCSSQSQSCQSSHPPIHIYFWIHNFSVLEHIVYFIFIIQNRIGCFVLSICKVYLITAIHFPFSPAYETSVHFTIFPLIVLFYIYLISSHKTKKNLLGNHLFNCSHARLLLLSLEEI